MTNGYTVTLKSMPPPADGGIFFVIATVEHYLNHKIVQSKLHRLNQQQPEIDK